MQNGQMRIAIGVVLIIAGLIWMFQGLDLPFAPESFMTSNPVWVAIGAATALAGVTLVWLRRRS